MELLYNNLNNCHKLQSKITGMSHCAKFQTSKFLVLRAHFWYKVLSKLQKKEGQKNQ